MPQRAIKYAVVDAFTTEPFKGNPAAVCLLQENVEVDKQWMLSVAKEFNTPITAFISPTVSEVRDAKSIDVDAPHFSIWWYSPSSEVDLCGHGTLAAAHFLYTLGLVKNDIISFVAEVGVVTANKLSKGSQEKFIVELNFPVVPMVEGDIVDPSLPKTLNGVSVVNIQKISANDLMIELSSGKEVAMLEPNFEKIKKCEGRRVTVTGRAPHGSKYDFFTRVFGPKFGVDEVYFGDFHTILEHLTAFLASPRTGVLYVDLDEKSQRVRIRGEVVTIMLGTLLA